MVLNPSGKLGTRGRQSSPSMTRRVMSPSGIIAFCWVIVLGALVPLLVLSAATQPFDLSLLIAGVITLHCAIGLSGVLSGNRIRLMQFGFWAFSYLFVGLAPLAQISTASYPTETNYLSDVSVRALGLVELGLLAFSAGVWFAGVRKSSSRTIDTLLAHRSFAAAGVGWAAAFSVVALIVLLPTFGGLGTFFSSRQASNQAVSAADGGSGSSTATGAIINWGLSIPPLAALLAMFALRAGPPDKSLPLPAGSELRTPSRRIYAGTWFWLAFAVILAINVIVNNPISQPRFWAGTVLLSLIFATKKLRRPGTFRLAAACVLFLLIVVFPYSDYFRYKKAQPIAVTSLSGQLTQNDDYDSFEQIESGVAYVDGHGFAPKNILGPVFFWVPRSLWHGKPSGTGGLLSRYEGYTLTNRSAPLFVEAYLWGGETVVILVFAGVGYLERRVDDTFDGARDSGTRLVHSYVPVMAFFQLIVLRGSLLQATAPLIMLIVIPLAMSRSDTRSHVAED